MQQHQPGTTAIPLYHHAVHHSSVLGGSLQHVDNYAYAVTPTGNGNQTVILAGNIGPEVNNKMLVTNHQDSAPTARFQQNTPVLANGHFYTPRLVGGAVASLNQMNQTRAGEMGGHPMFVGSNTLNHLQVARPLPQQQQANQGGVLLRNLPASRRAKSFRSAAGTAGNESASSRPPPPLPLPPIPTEDNTSAPLNAPLQHPEVRDSTISLKSVPDPKSTITQL